MQEDKLKKEHNSFFQKILCFFDTIYKSKPQVCIIQIGALSFLVSDNFVPFILEKLSLLTIL